MDISKIISDSIDKVVKDVTNGNSSTYPVIDDDAIEALSEQNVLLMNYSNTLLELYHKELRKTLAEQGIKI